VLFDRRGRELGLNRFDVGGYGYWLEVLKVLVAGLIAPREKLRARPKVSCAGICVSNRNGEKFCEAIAGLLAGASNPLFHRCNASCR